MIVKSLYRESCPVNNQNFLLQTVLFTARLGQEGNPEEKNRA